MSVPFVDEASIQGAGLSYPAAIKALREAFESRARGDTDVTPKVAAAGDHGGFFHAMPQVLGNLAVVKWVSSGSRPNGKYLYAHLFASDATSGAPIAVLDFSWLTGVRTAAVSALTVDLLADPSATTVSIFGCGLQARTHVQALRSVRPIQKVIAVSRNLQEARAFAEEIRRDDLAVEPFETVTSAFYQSDIIISASPLYIEPELDAGLAKLGALVLAVDLGHAWLPDSWSALDAVVTDDIGHFKGMRGNVGAAQALDFHSDLPSLLAEPGRLVWDPSRRLGAIPPGLALSDAAVAGLVIETMGLKAVA